MSTATEFTLTRAQANALMLSLGYYTSAVFDPQFGRDSVHSQRLLDLANKVHAHRPITLTDAECQTLVQALAVMAQHRDALVTYLHDAAAALGLGDRFEAIRLGLGEGGVS